MKLIDPWEYKYIKHNPNQLLIAWDDSTAYRRYQRARWIYNKYYVSKRYNKHKCYDLDKEFPRRYPVMVKPKINLTGLSKGAYKANNRKELIKTKGMIAQKFYKGTQYTTDICIYKGEIVDYFTFITHKDNQGSIICFESTQNTPYKVLDIAKDCGLKNVIINIETINNNIIEMHLRPSLQFYDICGGMIEGYLKQLAENVPVSQYQKCKYEKTFSYVLRRSTDIKPSWLSKVLIPTGVRSVQLCYEKGKYLSEYDQDEFSYRFACINGDNFKEILTFAPYLEKELTGENKCGIFKIKELV